MNPVFDPRLTEDATQGGLEPVFEAPWQAQAFAITVRLHDQGIMSWTEWTEYLSAEIAAAKQRGDADRGDTYYEHWLGALERLAAAKGLVSAGELADRRDAWDRAARATPHGEPIALDAAARKSSID